MFEDQAGMSTEDAELLRQRLPNITDEQKKV